MRCACRLLLVAASLTADVIPLAAVSSAEGPPCSSVGVTCAVGRGEIKDSALGLTEVVWVGPESRGVYVGSPSIVHLRNGTALASHDFFGSRGTLNATVQVLRDDSAHVSGPDSRWVYAGNVSGIYWANLFTLGAAATAASGAEEVYLMGASFGDAQVGTYGRSIVISRSVTAGRSWSKPSVLFAGGKLGTPGYRSYGCAPTPTIHGSDGRLYRNFAGRGGINIIMTRDPVTPATDLLAAATWRSTTPLPFVANQMVPHDWRPPVACHSGRDPACMGSQGCAAAGCGCSCFTVTEGNAVEAPNGTIYSILRVNGQSNVTYNKAAVFRRDVDTPAHNPAGEMTFAGMIDFPSTQSKFTIRRQPPAEVPSDTVLAERRSRMGNRHYYTLSSSVTSAAISAASHCPLWNTPFCQATIGARNHLVLARSEDGIADWRVCDTLLSDDTGFTIEDSARFTGFQYVDWVFDVRQRENIHYAVRTGYRGANTYHNANRLTVNTVENVTHLCAWTDQFKSRGEGWCRPVTNYTNAGPLSTRACALACLASSSCLAFAVPTCSLMESNCGHCALYAESPTNTSGDGGFQCFARKAASMNSAIV